jgi:hypothetical protein
MPTQPDPTLPGTLINRILARLAYDYPKGGIPLRGMRPILAEEVGRWLQERGEWTEAERRAWTSRGGQ